MNLIDWLLEQIPNLQGPKATSTGGIVEGQHSTAAVCVSCMRWVVCMQLPLRLSGRGIEWESQASAEHNAQ